jgi:hypothetical protein
MSSGLSDDDREFAFKVEIVGDLWPDDVGEMPGLAIGNRLNTVGFSTSERPVPCGASRSSGR